MSHQTRKVKASELIEDFSIYPRNCVFDGHVYDLAESIRSGAAMPPCVADAKTLRLTDGFHRRRAWVRVYGDDAEIETMLVGFSTEADMVCDSIARNAAHGRRLTTADIARCATLGKKFRISRERLSGLLHVTRDRLTEIVGTRCASGPTRDVVLRRPMAHLADKRLTRAQESVADHVGGQTAMYHVNVLIKLIESKSLPDDENLLARLRQLHGFIGEVI